VESGNLTPTLSKQVTKTKMNNVGDIVQHVLPFVRQKLKCRVVCQVWMKEIKTVPVENLVLESDQTYRTVPYRRQEREAIHAIVSSERDAKRKLEAVRNISNIVKHIEFLGFRGNKNILRVLVREFESMFPETKRVSISYCDAKDVDFNTIASSRKIEFIGCNDLVLPQKCDYLYIDQSNVTMEDLQVVHHDQMKFVSARFTPALRTFLLSVFPQFDTYLRRVRNDNFVQHYQTISFSNFLDLVTSKITQGRDHFSRLDMLIWTSNYEARFDDLKSAVRELVLDCYTGRHGAFLTMYQQFLFSDMRQHLDLTSIVTAEGTSRPCSLAIAAEMLNVSAVSLILERGMGNPQYSCTSSEDSVCSLIVATARDTSQIIEENAVKILKMFLPHIDKPSRQFRLGWTYVLFERVSLKRNESENMFQSYPSNSNIAFMYHSRISSNITKYLTSRFVLEHRYIHFVAQENWSQTRRGHLGLDLLCILLDDLAIPPSVQDYDGTTPLMVAAFAGNILIVSELSRRMNASELMMTDDSGTALHAAVKAGHARCVEVIANAMFRTYDVNEFNVKNELRLALSLRHNLDIESEHERHEREYIVLTLIRFEDLVLEQRSIRKLSRRKRRRLEE